ncbi:hypothetical protein [Ruegeria arenilitoris]|uniref:hypothetical protein n=1 Tax=Ruegeria arenilitoris TaxID=1173585 RepID=UPI00147FD163|nr:hypothetical protein [Ruegeria arenilitoris]
MLENLHNAYNTIWIAAGLNIIVGTCHAQSSVFDTTDEIPIWSEFSHPAPSALNAPPSAEDKLPLWNYSFLNDNNIEYHSKTRPERSWWTGSFVYHYFFGNKDRITLEEIGLDDKYVNSPSVRALIEEFVDEFMNLAETEGKHNVFYQYSRTAVTDVTQDWQLFPVGNSAFYMEGNCYMSECVLHFSIEDEFKHPLYWDEMGLGSRGEIGTKYKILHQFTQPTPYLHRLLRK